MPKVSVVIPCYNHGQFIDEAVESVLNQTFQDFEITIVNDGSTDDYTNKLLENYEKPKTSVYKTINQGQPEARNFGISKSHGEYIVALDADDKLERTYLEKAVKVLDEDIHHELGFVNTWLKFYGNKTETLEMSDYDPDTLGIKNVVHVSSMFRKECWEKVSGYDVNMKGYEDWDLWISIVECGYKWKLIPENLFLYRSLQNIETLKSREVHNDLCEKILLKHKTFFTKNYPYQILERVKIIHQYEKMHVEQLQLINQQQAYIDQQQAYIDQQLAYKFRNRVSKWISYFSSFRKQ